MESINLENWNQIIGYPKIADGPSMDYQFALNPGGSGFFQVARLENPPPATQTTLNPSEDAHSRDGTYASNNYGTSALLEVKKDTTNYGREAYLKFDTASVTGSVTSAKLRIYCTLSAAASISIGVYPVASTGWTETGITWNTKPASGATALATQTVSTSGAWYEFDVSNYVSSERNAGRYTLALAVKSGTTTSVLLSFNSRENAANPAELVLTTGVSTGTPPIVSLTAPANGANFAAPATIALAASASDSDGTISKVEFFQGNTLLATDTTSPYTYSWPGVAEGTYVMSARATDNGGATTDSATRTVTVSEPPSTDPFTASSYLGGTGTADGVRGAEIQSNGTIVLAANISNANPGGVSPILLNGATSSTSGAVIRLTASGKTVLSVTRVATEIQDLSIDGNDNIYLAARTQGLIKLNSSASTVLYANTANGACDRVDAAPNGTVAALKNGFDVTGTGSSPVAYVYDASGTQLGSANGLHNRCYDVAISDTYQTVYLIGFSQGNGPSGNPVQVAYLRATSYAGTQKWLAYDWTPTQVDEPNTNNMADTRGLRMDIGQDGKLYAAFMCAGGNHIFRFSPFNLATPVSIVGGDGYHQFYNTKSEHKTFFARYDAGTGAYLKGQQFTARLSTGAANSAWPDHGSISADSAGRVYLGLSANTNIPYTFNPVASTEYGGGPILLIMSPNFDQRLFVGRTTSVGSPWAGAARVLSGHTNPNVVFGGDTTSTTLWRNNPIQNSMSTATDGFFAAKPDMTF